MGAGAVIAFRTLFLGLVSGPWPVEVLVAPEVAVVRFSVDGVDAGEASAPLWRGRVDLGALLRPHEIVAVARDAAGRELGRVRQRVNMPGDEATVEALVVRAGERRELRLTWASLVPARVVRQVVEVDGTPLVLADPQRVLLPRLDLATAHIVRVTVEFEGGAVARREVAVGGPYTETASSHLTAVPIVWARRGSPTAAASAGTLVRLGSVLRVVAVEEGAAELLVVLDQRAAARLAVFAAGAYARWRRPGINSLVGGSDRVSVVDPVPRVAAAPGVPVSLVFPIHANGDASVKDVIRHLAGTRSFAGRADQQDLASAVAVAGLAAAGSQRRRAVVLVLAGAAPDPPEAIAAARELLRCLRVPLVVWCVGRTGACPATAWSGAALRISRESEVLDAERSLVAELEHQRIVWVDGDWMPQEIEPAAGSGVRLVGAPPPA